RALLRARRAHPAGACGEGADPPSRGNPADRHPRSRPLPARRPCLRLRPGARGRARSGGSGALVVGLRSPGRRARARREGGGRRGPLRGEPSDGGAVIERIVHASVVHRRWVVGCAALVCLVLAFFALRLSFDALPDVTPNQVQILTRAPGLTPEEVERLVTRPIEAALGGMPGLVTQRSTSQSGLSEVVAVFEDRADPYRARQLVQERLATVSVPAGVDAPELGPLS